MGAPGQTSLINNLFNFILGFDWNYPARFILKEDGQEETQSISVYEIRHANGFRIPFSLTIVDVCVVTPSHDFTEMLDNFLQSGAIQGLDLIGLVSSANCLSKPSCESILSHFGKDLKENIHLIDVEPFLDLVPRLKFKNFQFAAGGRNGLALPSNQWNTFEEFVHSFAEKTSNRLITTRHIQIALCHQHRPFVHHCLPEGSKKSFMLELRKSWSRLFPSTDLYALDILVKSIDPEWPITAPMPPAVSSKDKRKNDDQKEVSEVPPAKKRRLIPKKPIIPVPVPAKVAIIPTDGMFCSVPTIVASCWNVSNADSTAISKNWLRNSTGNPKTRCNTCLKPLILWRKLTTRWSPPLKRS